VTNGNSIIIICRESIRDKLSTIEAIPTETRKAGIESQGDSGAEVHIVTTSKIHGKLNVDLSAQAGGDGKNGRNRANGLPGSPGANKASGGNGGNAGNGKPGTNGGEGGNGGLLEIHYIETAVQQDLDISFVSKAGTGGKAGQGALEELVVEVAKVTQEDLTDWPAAMAVMGLMALMEKTVSTVIRLSTRSR
jgi:hypothetical protein